MILAHLPCFVRDPVTMGIFVACHLIIAGAMAVVAAAGMTRPRAMVIAMMANPRSFVAFLFICAAWQLQKTISIPYGDIRLDVVVSSIVAGSMATVAVHVVRRALRVGKEML